jgi:hypothetical protein
MSEGWKGDSQKNAKMPDNIHKIIVGAGPRACPENDNPHENGQTHGIGQPRGVAPTGKISVEAPFQSIKILLKINVFWCIL